MSVSLYFNKRISFEDVEKLTDIKVIRKVAGVFLERNGQVIRTYDSDNEIHHTEGTIPTHFFQVEFALGYDSTKVSEMVDVLMKTFDVKYLTEEEFYYPDDDVDIPEFEMNEIQEIRNEIEEKEMEEYFTREIVEMKNSIIEELKEIKMNKKYNVEIQKECGKGITPILDGYTIILYIPRGWMLKSLWSHIYTEILQIEIKILKREHVKDEATK